VKSVLEKGVKDNEQATTVSRGVFLLPVSS
jgi:hypothetical protein